MTTRYNRFAFIVQYYDMMAQMIRNYQLFYYPEDSSIEMFDMKNQRVFLKRIINQEVNPSNLYLGAEFSIYSRLYKVIEYGDDFTKKKFEQIRTSCFALILPPAYMHIGKIIDRLQEKGFTIGKAKMNKLTEDNVVTMLKLHQSADLPRTLLGSDFVVGLELIKENSCAEVARFIADCVNKDFKAVGDGPMMVCSSSEKIAQDEISYFFALKAEPQLTNCSLLIIKQHVIFENKLGKILDIILNEGFEISSMNLIHLDKHVAENFFEVYKGVLPEYDKIITDLTSGTVLCLELRQDDVVNKVRALVGPHDPVIAKALRPNSLRAIFGRDRVRNVCHCTDLPEDGPLECQYFFEFAA